MKRQGAAGVAALYRRPGAASEEFSAGAAGNQAHTLTRAVSGWDPYDVWRTRVKKAFPLMQAHKSGTFRWWRRVALRSRAAVA